MPGKGHALDRWVVNKVHKTEEQKLARAAAAADTPHDEFEKELCTIIDDAKLPSACAANAHKDIKRILADFRAGNNPFTKLKPHRFCGSCAGGLTKEGNPHRTHEFFCMSRKQVPPLAEETLRKRIFARLRGANSARQYALQVSASSAR